MCLKGSCEIMHYLFDLVIHGAICFFMSLRFRSLQACEAVNDFRQCIVMQFAI